MTSLDVRSRLVDALALDLIGPEPGSPLAEEILPQPPTQWYLTGFLAPFNADADQRSEATSDESIDQANDAGQGDDAAAPEKQAARRTFFPSSMGVSVLVPKEAKTLRAIATWGVYNPVGEDVQDPSAPTPREWKRTPCRGEIVIPISSSTKPQEHLLPGADHVFVAVSVRTVKDGTQFMDYIPRGTRVVSVFLLNKRGPAPDAKKDAGFIFQAALELRAEVPFVSRPNVRGLNEEDWDERVADLHYRDVCEYAVGHAVSTRADLCENECKVVRTSWIPTGEVERVAPADIPGVELGMESLAALADGTDAQAKLGPLVTGYRAWIDVQEEKVPTSPEKRKKTGEDLLNKARIAANRIAAGIDSLADPQVLEAFRLANKAMARAARQRRAFTTGTKPEDGKPPAWRPFQLAFILMNLPAMHTSSHPDRAGVDLLFFPTGGGKTEAYLGLAAFTLVLRRFKHPGVQSAGLSVLMRYTLRLLTLDQLGRAATLICALELERQADVEKLGAWPFEIGLWVGRAATPNVMGRKGDSGQDTARARTNAFKNKSSLSSPIPIDSCPWCGSQFTKESFTLVPNADEPTDLRITCSNDKCPFIRNNALPILTVDEPIYRRLPCFLIATVDKFASLPWTGPVGGFFGRVERYDRHGFYGPCDPGIGLPVPGGGLPPPDLVIQDELHLISGPMGTMVGLYETALDELCSRQVGGTKVKPKIVASTATVRRADRQIRALFGRNSVDIFPAPGPDRRDSFFARTHLTTESPARLYVGVAAQGRSVKVALLRVYLALLSAAQKQYQAAGRQQPNPADPYMTLLGYFNSLRELGGTRRIVEDEIVAQLTGRSARKRVNQAESDFANRKINFEVVELTSRVSTDQVAKAKAKLSTPFPEKDCVDVAIATNMISVGLDITRLGLMVVLGQPKTSAEYIQATSRVGRAVNGKPEDKPGLVVTILNVHRPRDRSHYERFHFYHETFYRSVEATSVTPFAKRALDRGLAGVTVALARQGHAALTAPDGAKEILREMSQLGFVSDVLANRAGGHDRLTEADAKVLRDQVRDGVKHLLDTWDKIAKQYDDLGVVLKYQAHEGGQGRPLLHDFLDIELNSLGPWHQKFKAARSMRDVEPATNLWVWNFENIEVEDGR